MLINDTSTIEKRLNEAAQMCDILVIHDADDASHMACTERRKVLMIAIKKGVSADWILNGRGLFWYKDNVMCDN